MPTNRLTRNAYVITVLLMENQSQKSSEVDRSQTFEGTDSSLEHTVLQLPRRHMAI